MSKKDVKKTSSKKNIKPLSDYHAAKKEECRKLNDELMKETASKKRGRPTKYNQEMADYIIKRVASSKVGLHKLCKMDDKLPSQDTINEWRWEYPDFSARYLLAKQHQSHLMAEYCEELSDEENTFVDAMGVQKVDPGAVANKRLQVDTRKWHAAKLNPQFFGDRKLVDEIKNQNEDLKNELMALRAELAHKNEKEY